MDKLNRKKLIIVGIFVSIFVLIIIVASIIIKNNEESVVNHYSERLDEISGQVTTTYQPTPEQGVTDLSLIGFSVFYDFGFSAQQQIEIYNTIYNFFSENYPDFTTISYIIDSFSYDSDNFYKSSFRVSSDTGDIFMVQLDTKGTLNTIDVDITTVSQ